MQRSKVGDDWTSQAAGLRTDDGIDKLTLGLMLGSWIAMI